MLLLRVAALPGPVLAQTNAPAPAPADTLRLYTALLALRKPASAAPAATLPQARALLAQAQALGYWRGTLLGCQLVYTSHVMLGQFGPALAVQRLRLKTARAHRELGTEATALADLSGIENQLGHHVEALRLSAAAEQLALTHPGTSWAGRVRIMALNNLSQIYYAQHRLPEAVRASGQAVRLQKAAGRTDTEMAAYISTLAIMYQENNQLDSAAYYARRALAVAGPRPDLAATARITLGDVALARHNLPEAEVQLTKARDLAVAVGLRGALLDARASLARLYLAQGQARRAADTLAQAQRGADGDRSLAPARDLARARAGVLAGLGRYRQAYAAARQDAALTDSLARLNQTQSLSAADRRAAEARQQARLTMLARENHLVAERNAAQRRLLLGGAAALAALLLGLAGLLALVGQLRRSRAALAAARASQDRLYAIVAHDLRGPVTALAGVAGQLEHYVARQDLAALQRLPPLVHRAVAGVNGLLDNLLSWAAAQTGELRARPEALPAAELLAEVVALYAPVAAAKNIELVLAEPAAGAGPEAAPGVWADRNMTRTILRNAVGNAVKFTPAGGRVALSARAGAAGRTVLAVQDSGPGLPPAELAAWASGAGEFTRRAGSRGEPGTGLGLRLAQTFAQRQGGAVRLASLPEKGTAFELELPAGA